MVTKNGHLSSQNGTLDSSSYSNGVASPVDGSSSNRTEEVNHGCGWLCFRPKCIQNMQTAPWVLFWLCWAGAVQGMVVNGFVNVSITTIEKRYHLKSADTGLIAGAYDIASVLCSIPVAYLGSLAGSSKPRWLGFGLVLMGFGSLVFALPHFSTPPYKDPNSSLDSPSHLFLCREERNASEKCGSKVDTWLSSYKHVFGLGQFIQGVGAAPLYTLGITFLDESVPVGTSSLYLGVFYAMAVVGPAIGYVFGGQLLNIYIDEPSISGYQLGLTSSTDQWLGAWWIGFVLSAVLASLVGLVVMAFPKELPGAKLRATQRQSEIPESSGVPLQKFDNLKDFPEASKVLVYNITFIFLSLAGATEGVLLTGFATFTPKFIESQFGLSASKAALVVGAIAVPAGGGGTLLGGWLIKHFHLKCAATLKLCAALSVICFLFSFSFIISCEDTNFAGVTVRYQSRGLLSSANLTAECNSKCQCSAASFEPVCGTDDILYFSPCHAGCTEFKDVEGRKEFVNCKCIPNEESIGSSAMLKKCPSSCLLLGVFLFFFFVIMAITFVISMPAVSATLRCVPDSHRALALGLQWIVIRVLGTIPGPILFGIIIDSTCRLWQESCNVIGACTNYSNYSMSRSMMAVSLVFKFLSSLFFALSWKFYAPPDRDSVNGGAPHSGNHMINVYQSSSSLTSISESRMSLDNPAFENT